MKRNILVVLLFGLTANLVAQTYHFQEGFVKTSPTGWVRNCGGTTSLNHGKYDGDGAAKFDITTLGEDKQLESPAVNGAGVLTFWASKNANASNYDLHVCKIVNGTTIELKKISYNEIARKDDWTEFTININDASNNIKVMIWAEAGEGVASFIAVDDIALTTYTEGGEEPQPGEPTVYDRIVTDFNDGTWGTVASALPTSGTYTTTTINDFVLNKAVLYTGSTTDSSGERHVNRIGIDKKSQGGNVELPWLKTVGQIEIHAAVGTAGNTFTVDEFSNNQWTTLQTFSAIKTDSTFYLNIERNETTRLRIANNSGGNVVIWKVVSRSLSEVKDLNVFSTTPTENAVCFYNLTKELTVNFNKEVTHGTGNLLLNDIQIPVSETTIEGTTVTIPVTLEGTQGTNKSYTLVIPQNAYADKSNTGNLNKEFTLNFQTLRTPTMPANYAKIVDIHYSDASEEMCRMDFYFPADANKSVPVVINMHGGGWNHGAKEEQTGFGSFFSMGFAVANVEYRMTPQAKAPAAVEDVRCAMQYLLNNAEQLNIDPHKIIFQGASAGGHLALTAAYLQNNRIYDTNCNDYANEIKVLAVIDKYGPSNLTNFMFYTSLVNWLGDNVLNTEFVNSLSPTEWVNAETPPTYIVHGDADPTVPYNQSELLVAKLKEYNVPYKFTTIPGGGHGGFESQYNTQISNEIKDFLTELLEKPQAIGEEKDQQQAFNPFIHESKIYFNLSQKAIFEIFDSVGNKITETDLDHVELARTGLYIIKATTSNGILAAKIIR